MQKIVPRWEWRSFGSDFGEAEARFASLAAEAEQESDEIYLLSPVCDANVKIRDALMDIKMLEQVNAAGLEQWCPVMKAGFPLTPDEAKKVCATLGVAAPSTARATFTLEQLQAELVAPPRGVRVVSVHKRRLRYQIEGCMSEMTELVADGAKARTVALEAEDARRVIDTVRALGLGELANTSYPRGLKQLIGMKS